MRCVLQQSFCPSPPLFLLPASLSHPPFSSPVLQAEGKSLALVTVCYFLLHEKFSLAPGGSLFIMPGHGEPLESSRRDAVTTTKVILSVFQRLYCFIHTLLNVTSVRAEAVSHLLVKRTC